jgi:3-hydroxybutyryl-CoA dehydrogenase
MEIREVAVVGLGTMGAGIAEVFARAGLRVVAIEADSEALDRGMSLLDKSLSRAVQRGRLSSAEQAEVLGRVVPAGGFAQAAGADLALEAVPERPELKRQVFAELDRACRPDAILATNTSSLSVTAIAAQTQHPERVVGMHFFNPAPVMQLVEVVGTVLAGDGVQAAVADLARRLGKTPVQVTDRAGFVANALLLPYLNQAVTLLETGFATREDIDAAATAGIGLPMGPLALLDLIGLDTALSVMEVLREEFGGSRYQPAPLLRRLVAAGRLGRKTGRGLYQYEAGKAVRTIRAGSAAAPPAAITVLGPAEGTEGELGAAASAAGLSVLADPGQPSDLVVVAASPESTVLAAALAAGRPGDTVGLSVSGGQLAELVLTTATTPAAAAAAEALAGRLGLSAVLAPDRPGDTVGLSVSGGQLAELVLTAATTPAAGAAAEALAGRLGLSAVLAPDRPGFLVGTLLFPHLADAVRMVADGYASVADVDAAMTLGCGYPRGPFELLDEAGAARAEAVLAAMQEAYGDPAFAPPPLLADYAAAGLSFRG